MLYLIVLRKIKKRKHAPGICFDNVQIYDIHNLKCCELFKPSRCGASCGLAFHLYGRFNIPSLIEGITLTNLISIHICLNYFPRVKKKNITTRLLDLKVMRTNAVLRIATCSGKSDRIHSTCDILPLSYHSA